MKTFFRVLMYFFGGLFILLAVLTIVYLLGPRPKIPVLSTYMPSSPDNLVRLEDSVKLSESSLPVKPGNQSRIIWEKDTLHQKTPYSLVYLHGFSASEEEGDPLHFEFAKRYGCNLYLTRLALHGLKDSNAFSSLTADSLYNTAKTALSIGMKLGDSVILMATSAGGALALTLAALEENKPIKALILYSPCVKIFNPTAALLDKPWGLQIARMVSKGNYIIGRQDSFAFRYWYPKYRIEGAIALQSLLDKAMNSTNFNKIKEPVLCLMYYKDPVHQDSTVSVNAIKTMFSELGTSPGSKMLIALPNVGDHVLAGYMRSKDLPSVRKATFSFAEQKLGLKIVQP